MPMETLAISVRRPRAVTFKWVPENAAMNLLALLAPLMFGASLGAQAGCSRPLEVPVAPIGLMVTVDQGQIGGAFVELLQEVGRARGCQFLFEAVPRARQEMLFLARRADVMLPAQRTERRDPFGQHVALLQVRPTLVALRPLPAAVQSRASLLKDSNLRVVVLRGVDNGTAYLELLEQLRAQGRLVVEADTGGVVRALREGLADAALMNPVIVQGQLMQMPELRGLQNQLQAQALQDLDWHPSGFYLSLERLPEADRQLLSQALGALPARQRLWQLLRERYRGSLLEAGYRPLPEPPTP